MRDFNQSHHHPGPEFEGALEAFLDDLSMDPDLSTEGLYARFPERTVELDRILVIARREVGADDSEVLPPPPDIASNLLAAVKSGSRTEAFVLPLRLGVYELLELIGDGGMGRVYRAAQHEPIEREVAIKIIREELGGTEILARFHNEQRSLAKMNHPNVAAVLDGGTTDDGRPYFVMELVDGQSLTEYCESQRLTLSERLEMFSSVCKGIQHAHQKGLIHRDIKQSNVLVRSVDGLPVPKVIDFGLAKAIAGDNTQLSSHTQLGQILGTLPYMSPEQASLPADGVDTRSDIFALGVLLFELITNQTPLEQEIRGELPIDERLRLVRLQQPVRPSDRLRRFRNTKVVNSFRGNSPAPTLQSDTESEVSFVSEVRRVRGDLDAICVKALAPDPQDRYQTVAGLLEDIENFLVGRPVSARQLSDWHMLLKHAYRYRATLGVVAGLACVLLGATIVSGLLAQRAQQAVDDHDYASARRLVALQESKGAELYPEKLPYQDFELGYWRNRTAIHRDIGRVASAEILTGHEDIISCVRFSRDEQWLMTTSDDQTTKVWELESGRMVQSIRSSAGMPSFLSVLPSHEGGESGGAGGTQATTPRSPGRAVVGYRSGVIEVRLIPNGELLKSLPAHEGAIYTIARDADNARVATAGSDGVVRIWNANSFELLQALEAHVGQIHTVAFSPDGTQLCSGGDDEAVIVWDLNTFRPHRRLTAHNDRVYAAAFSPDGRHVVYGGRDQTHHVFDAHSGAWLRDLSGHSGTIHALQFTRSGQTLISGGSDQRLRFWDWKVGEIKTNLSGHDYQVQDLRLSQSEHVLASVSDTTIRLWHSPPQEMVPTRTSQQEPRPLHE